MNEDRIRHVLEGGIHVLARRIAQEMCEVDFEQDGYDPEELMEREEERYVQELYRQIDED